MKNHQWIKIKHEKCLYCITKIYNFFYLTELKQEGHNEWSAKG